MYWPNIGRPILGPNIRPIFSQYIQYWPNSDRDLFGSNSGVCAVVDFELHFARIVQEIRENPGNLTDSHSTIKRWLLMYGVSLAFCVCTLVEDRPRTWIELDINAMKKYLRKYPFICSQGLEPPPSQR
jgi:hypothetical protein